MLNVHIIHQSSVLISKKVFFHRYFSSDHVINFNAARYLFSFRLRNSGKQQKLLEDFKRLAVACGTKREFRLEALLACICRRLGCKYISREM